MKNSETSLTLSIVKELITNNDEWMKLLTIVNQLNLNDCWIAAGTIRNYLWNVCSGLNHLDKSTDIDVVFFDHTVSYDSTVMIENELKREYLAYQWEVKNQVYMHSHNPNTSAYSSTRDAISKYPEQCTAVGVRLSNEEVEVFSPYGFDDIEHFIVRPTPYYLQDKQRRELFNKRVLKKNWIHKYPQLQIEWIK